MAYTVRYSRKNLNDLYSISEPLISRPVIDELAQLLKTKLYSHYKMQMSLYGFDQNVWFQEKYKNMA